MSAIIAGKCCVSCRHAYYVSLGHPRWYDDVVKRGKPKCDNFKRFEHMVQSGMCVACYYILEYGPRPKMRRMRKANET